MTFSQQKPKKLSKGKGANSFSIKVAFELSYTAKRSKKQTTKQIKTTKTHYTFSLLEECWGRQALIPTMLVSYIIHGKRIIKKKAELRLTDKSKRLRAEDGVLMRVLMMAVQLSVGSGLFPSWK